MGNPEDTLYGKNTNTQNENSNKSENNQSNILSDKGTWVEKGTTRKNSSSNAANTTSTANKYYKEIIKMFGAVLASRYEKLELNKSFDIFRENLINYMIK